MKVCGNLLRVLSRATCIRGPFGVTIRDASGLTCATSSFRWAEIESVDYRQYVANLRAVGCPEQIIRDMIVADMNQLFSARAQAIWKPRVTEYWQKPVNDRPGPQQMEQLLALDTEKRAVFQDFARCPAKSAGVD